MTRRGSPTLTLALTEVELDVVIAGLSQMAAVCDDDSRFADAAEALLQRINDALPPPAGTGTPAKRGEPPLRTTIRRAIDAEEALWLRYADKGGRASERTVWPIAFSILGSEELVAAWCESRADFRHFRLDRIVAAEPTGRRYPRRQRLLLAAWQRQLDEDGMG